MKRFYFVGFLALMMFDTLAQVSFKFASIYAIPLELNVDWLVRVFSHPWIYGAFIGYIGGFFTWMTLLKYAPIGPGYAATHMEIVSVTLISIWLFDEHLTVPKVIGGILILLGILCLAKSKAQEPESQESLAEKPTKLSANEEASR